MTGAVEEIPPSFPVSSMKKSKTRKFKKKRDFSKQQSLGWTGRETRYQNFEAQCKFLDPSMGCCVSLSYALCISALLGGCLFVPPSLCLPILPFSSLSLHFLFSLLPFRFLWLRMKVRFGRVLTSRFRLFHVKVPPQFSRRSSTNPKICGAKISERNSSSH